MSKKFNLVWILVAIVLIIYGLFSLVYNFFLIESVFYEPVMGGVNHTTTFLDITKENLTMGHLTPGTSMTRYLDLRNIKDYKINVKIIEMGIIKDSLSVEPKEFSLAPYETQRITLVYSPSPEIPEGDYTGELKIISRRVLW